MSTSSHAHQPLALEVGKPMITFCHQTDDICYVGEEALGIIEDSDEMFRAIQEMISRSPGEASAQPSALPGGHQHGS